MTASVEVQNTSDRTGDEVVQLYTRQIKPSVVRPRKELRGFQRVTLQPGEKKTVTISVPGWKLAFYDVNRHAFVVEPGAYEVQVGASSADIRAGANIQVAKEWVSGVFPPAEAEK